MAIIAADTSFEKPKPGKYIATIIDVADLGEVVSKNPQFPGTTHRVQIVWVLNVNGANGKPLLYSEAPPLKIGEPKGNFKATRLYDICLGVLGQPPARPYDVEAMLMGKSNEIFLVANGDRVNIAGFIPVPPGSPVPVAPPDFERKAVKDAKKAAKAAAAPAQPAQAVPDTSF